MKTKGTTIAEKYPNARTGITLLVIQALNATAEVRDVTSIDFEALLNAKLNLIIGLSFIALY